MWDVAVNGFIIVGIVLLLATLLSDIPPVYIAGASLVALLVSIFEGVMYKIEKYGPNHRITGDRNHTLGGRVKGMGWGFLNYDELDGYLKDVLNKNTTEDRLKYIYFQASRDDNNRYNNEKIVLPKLSEKGLAFIKNYLAELTEAKEDTQDLQDIYDTLTKKLPVEITHIPYGQSYKNNTESKSPDKHLTTTRTAYGVSLLVSKPQLHWGQLKLFISEVQLLVEALKLHHGDKKIVFVYAGSAPGDHIPFLRRMFPMIEYHLYDPNPFIAGASPGIFLYNEFFTDEVSAYWTEKAKKENLFLIFCSDVRREPATAANVAKDMETQKIWWNIIQPDIAMFKFRLPWVPGKTKYLEGQILTQVYPGKTSTETRLLVSKDAKEIEYDHNEYNERCYYHNRFGRTKSYPKEFDCTGDPTIEKNELDTCFDCSMFVQTIKSYMTSIIEYHKKDTALHTKFIKVSEEYDKYKASNYLYRKHYELEKRLIGTRDEHEKKRVNQQIKEMKQNIHVCLNKQAPESNFPHLIKEISQSDEKTCRDKFVKTFADLIVAEIIVKGSMKGKSIMQINQSLAGYYPSIIKHYILRKVSQLTGETITQVGDRYGTKVKSFGYSKAKDTVIEQMKK